MLVAVELSSRRTLCHTQAKDMAVSHNINHHHSYTSFVQVFECLVTRVYLSTQVADLEFLICASLILPVPRTRIVIKIWSLMLKGTMNTRALSCLYGKAACHVGAI